MLYFLYSFSYLCKDLINLVHYYTKIFTNFLSTCLISKKSHEILNNDKLQPLKVHIRLASFLNYKNIKTVYIKQSVDYNSLVVKILGGSYVDGDIAAVLKFFMYYVAVSLVTNYNLFLSNLRILVFNKLFSISKAVTCCLFLFNYVKIKNLKLSVMLMSVLILKFFIHTLKINLSKVLYIYS